MRGNTFQLYMSIKPKRGHTYPETAHPKGCVVCGAKPVLYTVGSKGWCGKCKDAAYKAAKLSREP